MKVFLYLAFLLLPLAAISQTEAHFKLTFDPGASAYILSMKSNTAFSGPLARISASTQVTIVAPHVAGGWTVTDLTGLQTTSPTSLIWQVANLNAPAENPSKDYLFFAPQNATAYTPFDFPAGSYIDIFSFKSGSGCIGDLALFDNTADPLNANVNINSDNNIVILGAGAGNKYAGNESGNVSCITCFSEAGTLGY